MRRLRICQLISSLEPPGPQRCVRELAGRLDRSRFDVRVVVLRGRGGEGHAGEADAEGSVLGRDRIWCPAGLAGIADLLRRGRFDVVHTHLLAADVLGRLGAASVGVAHLVHTVHAEEMRTPRWTLAYARLLSAGCDRIVCVSRWVRDCHARRCGLGPRAYAIIPYGIDLAALARNPARRRRLRGQWGIGDDEVVFAFVGPLDRHAGIHTLISAVCHLGARGEPQHLVVAGDGPKRYVVENYARYGEGGRRTRYLGGAADVRDVLSAADVFVMPSRAPGSPLAAIEAMAASLPVIATRLPGVLEVVVDQQTALTVWPGDSRELAGAIERMALDHEFRARLGPAGREDVTRRFPLGAAIEAHARLYEEIARHTRRRRA